MDTRLEPTPILSCLHLMELFPVHIVIKGPRKLPDVIKIFKLMTALIIIVDAFKRSFVGFEIKHLEVGFGTATTLTFV